MSALSSAASSPASSRLSTPATSLGCPDTTTSAAMSSIRDRLTGAWILQSILSEARNGDKSVPPVFGNHPNGLLLYTPDGYVSACVDTSEAAIEESAIVGLQHRPDALSASIPASFIYNGPYELTDPKEFTEEYLDGRKPDAIISDRTESAINPVKEGEVLVREATFVTGRDGEELLDLRLNDLKPYIVGGGAYDESISLTMRWRRAVEWGPAEW